MPTLFPPLTPPVTAPVDVDSVAARQARTSARSDARVLACRQNLLATVVGSYSDLWGALVKTKAADGTVTSDPGLRANEDGLSPIEVLAGYGTNAAAKLEAYHLIIADAIQLGATDGIHPITGEDMTTAPAGWTLTPQDDGSVVASYTAPAASPTP